jgi:hypothetical protein
MSAKDWFTVVLSLLAFIIAALSAYWNIIRQVDDVRILIGSIPSIRVSD